VLGLIGLDSITAQPRLTFDRMELYDGIGLVPVVMGLFGIAEVLANLERPIARKIIKTKLSQLWPNRDDWKASAGPIARGTVLGFFLGILPGGGAVISSFASYALEKRLSKTPERFGRGAIEGVAGPEAANNAAAAGVLVPLLTLGLPTSATAAILLAAFQGYGIQPGPTLLTTESTLVWTLIAALFIGNTMLLVLNLPLAGLWVKLLRIPRPYLYAGILLFASLGSYAVNADPLDLVLLLVLGFLGFFMRRYGWPVAPAVIGLILGPVAETNLRRALAISGGDLSVLVETWFSRIVLLLALLALVVPIVLRVVRGRRSTPEELQHGEGLRHRETAAAHREGGED
jgi:putative tricarboxylic transport membrane protein